jgi:ATP-binding cassette subfamily B protein
MGASTPPHGVNRTPGQAPTSIRERVGALRNLPPFLKLVWQTSPAIGVAVIALRLVRALLPVATLYVGALIIDAVVKGIPSGDFG